MSAKELPINDQIKIEITTAKSVMVFLQAWLGKNGENLNLRSKNATEKSNKKTDCRKNMHSTQSKAKCG